jgi:tRNA(fMet)-specific endonuclease VapC
VKYILDANIISFLIDKKEKRRDIVKKRIFKTQFLGNEILISAISYYEIKRGLLHVKSPRKEEEFNQICQLFQILLYDDLEIFDEASQIFADLRKIGKPTDDDADILIGALAKVKKAVLVTNNVKHFIHIKDLKLANFCEDTINT